MTEFSELIQNKINNKTKPIGSLGFIETIAKQICLIQQTLNPQLKKPTILVFAADHGIAESGVSAYPTSVTAQMVKNFINGGAAINVFCKQNDIELKIIDAGVNYDFTNEDKIMNCKIALGTHNYLVQNAMSKSDLDKCFEYGRNIIDSVSSNDCNIIGFGEMGIGNTSSASLLMSYLCKLDIEECVGRGTGLDDEQYLNKLQILKQVVLKHNKPSNVYEALECFGGFEIAQICSAMLHSYDKNMIIMVDGFIATAAFLCAHSIQPNIINNAIFCHQSDESGHKKMLDFLNVKPILNINLRLGEGTGCALAYPIIKGAVTFINDMASFETAGVSNKII